MSGPAEPAGPVPLASPAPGRPRTGARVGAAPDGVRGDGARSRELRLRIASAAVLVPLGIACLAAGGIAWDAIVLLASAAVCVEWAGMCRAPRAAGAALAVACLACGLAASAGRADLAIGLACVAAAVLSLGRGAAFGAGLPYAAVPAVALVWLRARPDGFAAVLLVLLAVWASDTGAFCAGRLIGGPRLAPALSPSKTWSGAAGGLAAAFLAGLAAGLADPSLAPRGAGACGLGAACLGIAAQAGDLLESAAKRRFGVKDSGALIPGHGGVLDRMDGLMAASLLAAAWVRLGA